MSELTAPVPRIYTTQFWLLCTSSLLFFASFNMIIPELPAYLTSLGGAQHKGLIISLFTVTALLSRPFSGRLADKLGRVPVMMAGSVVCLLCSLAYPVLSSVAGFLLLRLVHGFSTGFTPTGQTAYLSDIIPAHRRGEAMGLLGTAGTVGMAIGPAIGGTLSNHFSINFLFYCSSFFALVAVMIVMLGIRETLHTRTRFEPAMLRIGREDLFEPRVWMPCIVMILSAYAYGAWLTIVPDLSEYVGIHNKGLLFTFFTIASFSARLIAGRASDRYGRKSILIISTTVIATGMIVLGLSHTPLMSIIGISIYGLGQGMTSPTLLAWATDLSDDRHKGRGLASLYMAMELGIGIGAYISGFVFNNQPANFFITFLTASLLSTLAFVFLILSYRIRASN